MFPLIRTPRGFEWWAMSADSFSIGLNEKPEGSRYENTTITKQISYALYFQSGE